ncbi:MAG: hypothetical protein ACLPTZ_30635 [Beijerinckiaceae bacterium]
MPEISATVSLRPVRIGFLVRPTDFTSVRTIMRYCTCIWGGVYNPIIPVFRDPPKEWKPEPFDRLRGLSIAKGYLKFFEPDVYVEAEKGLLEAVGLVATRQKWAIYSDVINLKEFLQPERHKDWSEPAFGLSIRDLHSHIYLTEQQFERRDRRENLLVKRDRSNAVTEAIFGAYPTQRDAAYFAADYKSAFRPTEIAPTPAAWSKAFEENAVTPLRVTRYGLEAQRFWHDDTLIYVFDPSRATDLIDLWNLRLEPHPVVPVPVQWFEPLADSIFKMLKSAHRPIQGNPQGLMHNATIEFGRSISTERANELIRTLKPGLPQGAVMVKHWRNRIWVEYHDDHVHRDRRMKVVAREQSAKLIFDDGGDLRTSFQSLSPDFSSRYGGCKHRWVNAMRFPGYGPNNIATILPFNLFDPDWPPARMGGERVLVGSEGLIFVQQFKDAEQYVQLLASDQAFIGWLERQGIKARLSEPGRIAKQMLENLGGLWGVHLLADMETLELLNKMAGGVRKRSNEDDTIEETFELRTASLKDWIDLIERRKQRRRLPEVALQDFTDKNIIRVGFETECPHCRAKNWSSLTALDYRLTCDRCLKAFDFPQARLREQSKNFYYRVVGPFSVPDYGRGSYASLLALRVINRFNMSMHELTFSTAMNLAFDGGDPEVDFLAWRRDDQIDHDEPPQFVVGEAKSGGKGQLIKPRDLAQLKVVAKKLPGTAIVIAVLRDGFLSTEKKLLKTFVRWCRRVDSDGEPTNPVLLLTSHELLFDHHISETWKSLGDPHLKFSNYEMVRTLKGFADATQQIYLGLPSFYAERRAQWERRMGKKRDAIAPASVPAS